MCIFYNSLSYSVLHFIVIRLLKYSLLEAFCCLSFSSRRGKEGKKIKAEIHRSHLAGMFGITLSVKMVRNKKEEKEGIFQTYFGCGVNCGVKPVVVKARGCLFFSSWAPQLVHPTCHPALRRERLGNKYPSPVVCPAAHQLCKPMLLQRGIEAAPSCGTWSCVPSGSLWRGAQQLCRLHRFCGTTPSALRGRAQSKTQRAG